MSNNQTLQEARKLHAMGIAVIALRPNEKLPVRKNWQKARLREDELANEFSDPSSNIGILLGAPSNGLLDIDLDCEEARAVAPALLPQTSAKFGRPSVGIGHYLYRVDIPPKGTKRFSFEGKNLAEIRSTGGQTMVPKSTHPSGESVAWFAEGAPSEVNFLLLRHRVQLVCAATVLIRRYPAKGTRHDLSLAVAGALCKAGVQQDLAETFVRSVTEHVGDEEVEARVANVAGTYRKVLDGEPIWELPKIEELLGRKVGSILASFLGIKSNAVARHEAAETGIELWISTDHVAHISFKRGDHWEHHPVMSGAVRRWVRLTHAAQGKPLRRKAVDEIIEEYEAHAHAGKSYIPRVRVAELDGAIYLDIGDEDWRAIQIKPDGWSIVDNSPVKFFRNPGMQSLPLPKSGSIDLLREFVNLESEDDFVLFVSALVGALIPDIPYVILSLTGEQGTAKSTSARVFRNLVDPNSAGSRVLPSTERELFIAAKRSWLLSFDNVSFIKNEMADALCRVSTGAAFVARSLYTNDDETFLQAKNPVVMNGISNPTKRQDVIDRSIILVSPVIEPERRKREKEFWSRFAEAAPHIMGSICDALSAVLRNRSSIELDDPPRMADFATAITAAESTLGWKPGTFINAYRANRNQSLVEAIAEEPLFEALKKCVAERGGEVIASATMLLAMIDASKPQNATLSQVWPVIPNQLSKALRRLAPAMREAGIEIDLDFKRDKQTHVKSIRLRSGLPPM